MVPSYVCPREPGRVSRDSERKAKWGNSKWYMEGMGFICCDSRNKDISGRILLQERRTTVDHIGCRLLPIYHPRAQVIHALCCDFITVHRIQIQGTHFCFSEGFCWGFRQHMGCTGPTTWNAATHMYILKEFHHNPFRIHHQILEKTRIPG